MTNDHPYVCEWRYLLASKYKHAHDMTNPIAVGTTTAAASVAFRREKYRQTSAAPTTPSASCTHPTNNHARTAPQKNVS